MEELFEEVVFKHLKEYYPRTKFYTTSSMIGGNKYIWVNKQSNFTTYAYLTYFRGEYWYACITNNSFKGKDVLSKELSILGFRVAGFNP
jgi:hypothetical protein